MTLDSDKKGERGGLHKYLTGESENLDGMGNKRLS